MYKLPDSGRMDAVLARADILTLDGATGMRMKWGKGPWNPNTCSDAGARSAEQHVSLYNCISLLKYPINFLPVS